MPLIVATSSRRRPDLEQAIVESSSDFRFVSDKIFTPRPVASRRGIIRTTKVANMMADVPAARAPGSLYRQLSHKLDSVSYDCDEDGLEDPIDLSEQAEFASEIDFGTVKTMRLWNSVRITQEKRVAAAVFNTTTFPLAGNTGHTSGTLWTSANVATANPMTDVGLAKAGILARCGMEPDSIVISENLWNLMWRFTTVRDSWKYVIGNVIPGVDDQQAVKQLAMTLGGLRNVFVANVPASADYDAASPTLSAVWSDTYAFVFKAAPASDPTAPGFGRMPTWATPDGGGAGAMLVERYQSFEKRSEVYRVVRHVDEVITQAEAGYLIKVQ